LPPIQNINLELDRQGNQSNSQPIENPNHSCTRYGIAPGYLYETVTKTNVYCYWSTTMRIAVLSAFHKPSIDTF